MTIWAQMTVPGSRLAEGQASRDAVEQVTRLRQLLEGPYKGKKMRLAIDLRIDVKTLNKVLRGGRVTDSTSGKIDTRLSWFSVHPTGRTGEDSARREMA